MADGDIQNFLHGFVAILLRPCSLDGRSKNAGSRSRHGTDPFARERVLSLWPKKALPREISQSCSSVFSLSTPPTEDAAKAEPRRLPTDPSLYEEIVAAGGQDAEQPLRDIFLPCLAGGRSGEEGVVRDALLERSIEQIHPTE